ncbi:hypothetical protein ACI79C_03115 [Geodermatophilus sp. SYSU D00697]
MNLDEPHTSCVLLPHGRTPPHQGPSLRLTRVPGPAGGLWLRPETSSGGDEWSPIGRESRWSPNDLVLAADWFDAVAAGEEYGGDRCRWFASPTVAFGLVEWNDDEHRLVIDVCLMQDRLAPWPTFREGGIDDPAGDACYMTVDLTVQACEEASLAWRCWAEFYGRTPFVRG